MSLPATGNAAGPEPEPGAGADPESGTGQHPTRSVHPGAGREPRPEGEPARSAGRSRVAVVTGGSRGIGRQAVTRLAADGFAVVLGYAGNRDLAEAAVKEVAAAGGRALAVQADVADEAATAALFDAAESAYGGVDVIVHAAGRMALSTVAELDLAELDAVHRTNIRGTFVVAQQAARRVRRGGAVITFSTSVLGLGFPGYAAYAASKGAVEAMTMILARELRGRDVTVNTVAPGPTATDLFLDGKDEETVARLAAQPPLERLGTPDDIAEVVAFLASPAGHWINGQIVRANGGIV
jgi:3-oxoacyl-[acyl-carrier protein] reductase